ncbi:MAG: phosphoribosylformylglycinamidine synthase subunit PurL, partial [Myxococcales bacterium]|nr:phosphoribosylformylglycinamidine synthase subunit PurL [Myxococcales bacterium]
MDNKKQKSFRTLEDLHLVDESQASEVGLTTEEFKRVQRLIGRMPNKVELGIIGALWSEHCSYKSTKAHLSKLPSKGQYVLVGPGENAGVLDIGDGDALVFKIESHNHPSFIEPFQGAATGVGGILRDVFTMGARPFLAANLLRFGEPRHKKVPQLFDGVVRGIASYGNCFGVATVLSNVDFDKSYNGNNLVNAFAMGVAKKEAIFLGAAAGIKNRLLYVGAKTGRDGIMGAVMASDTFGDETDKRPTVQVGDPFKEKLLLEACLQCFEEGLVVGIQDMGAAGMTSSCFEMANRGSVGLSINLDDVPVRDAFMSAYDIMLSESQERMVMVAQTKNVSRIQEIFSRYELDAVDIGAVTGDGIISIHYHGNEVAHLAPTLIIENAPRYRRSYHSTIPKNIFSLKQRCEIDLKQAFSSWRNDLGQKDVSFITDQFDHHIGINTLIEPGCSDAAFVKVPNSQKAVALSLLAMPRLLKNNSFEGARRTIFTSLLEISVQGCKAIGISNCLNYGSPENEEVMTQLKNSIDGMAQAATQIDVPIISGNVSLYNETRGSPILPTLALSMVGLSGSPQKKTIFSAACEEDEIVLLGSAPKDYVGSEAVFHDETYDNHHIDAWEHEKII